MAAFFGVASQNCAEQTAVGGYVQRHLVPEARLLEARHVARISRVDIDPHVIIVDRVPLVGVEVDLHGEQCNTAPRGVEHAQIAPRGTVGDGGADGHDEERETVGRVVAFDGCDGEFDGGGEVEYFLVRRELHGLRVQDAADAPRLWEAVGVGFREANGGGSGRDVGVALVSQVSGFRVE